MKPTDPKMKIQRLYDAAELLAGVTGKSNVARLLEISPQQLANWEKRGISQEGLIKCQKKLGVSIEWLESAEGEMKSDGAVNSSPITPMFIEQKTSWPFEKIGPGWIAGLNKAELKTLEMEMINCLLRLDKNRESTHE